MAVSQHEPRVVSQHCRKVPHLHPALGPPAHELDFLRGEVRAARDSGRTVVLIDAVIDHQAALDEIARHRCARIGRRMLDVGPVDILPREGEVGVNRLRRIVRIADDQPANDEHAVTVKDVHGRR